MRFNLQSLALLLLLYNAVTHVAAQDFQQSYMFRAVDDVDDRDKRAVDLGFLVRNFLMKSAYASNAKAAASRNLINLKTTTTRRPTTTTTRRPVATTAAPFAGLKSFWFPFSASLSAPPPVATIPSGPGRLGPRPVPPRAGGPRGNAAFNFDYDYFDRLQPVAQAPAARRRRPTTTTTAAPAPTTAAPPPAVPLPRRRPLPKRPQILNFDYYDDYDYGALDPSTPAAPRTTTTAAPPPPPPPPPPSRPRPRQRRPQAAGGRPMAPRGGIRQDRPNRLRNPLIYRFAQTNGKIAQLVTNCRTIGFSPSLCRFLYQ